MATLALKRQAVARLLDHFGDVRLDRITRAGAFRVAMLDPKLELPVATVARYIRDAKEILGAAKRQDLVRVNPFDRVSAAVPKQAKDWHFVSRADLGRLLGAVPNTSWRPLVALCRLAGLRRGEALRLTVDDADEVARTIRTVPEGGVEGTKQAARVVPIEPELMPVLREAIDDVPEGEARLCWRIRASNVDRDVREYLKRAGIPEYAKPLHTLRKNLESEWMDKHPAPAVCEWLGHSEDVAREHYHRPTAETLAKVTGKQPQEASVRVAAKSLYGMG